MHIANVLKQNQLRTVIIGFLGKYGFILDYFKLKFGNAVPNFTQIVIFLIMC